jgi:alpha-amylase
MRHRLVNEELLRIWRYLGSSDHLYYMFTAGGAPGEVHSYFSPYNNPYDAFITYLSVLMDFDTRIRKDIVQANEPFIFTEDGKFLRTVYGMRDFIEALDDISTDSIKFHVERDDFEKWARHSLKDPVLGDELKNIKLQRYDIQELRGEIKKAFERRLRETKMSMD